MVDLSVVIPLYNEELTIRSGSLEKVWKYFSKQPYTWEVLLVNDASTDATAKLCLAFSKTHKGFRLLNEPHRGKAGNVVAGMLAAQGKIVMFADADLSTPIDQAQLLIDKINEGNDIAIGSRSGRHGTSVIRKIMSLGLVVLRTVILALPFKDTQCGFKAFTHAASDKVFGSMKLFGEKDRIAGYSVTAGFDLEMLFVARKLGLKVGEVPVKWSEERKVEHVNHLKDSWIGFRDILRLRINSLKGNYNG